MDRCRERGFTLLEMLIAVIVLGILAMVIIPQITVSSDDAKVSAVKADLSAIRSAIEMYYQQHNSTYPPCTDDATGTPGNFTLALTLYSDASGATAATKDATHIYGPYIKSDRLPINPFNNSNFVACNTATAVNDRTPVSAKTATHGWSYAPATGVFFANDNGMSSSIAHTTY